MPVTIKAANLKYKNEQGEYVGVNSVSDQTTAEQIAAIESAGEEVIDSIPSDYSALSQAVSRMNTATATDVGKALKVKTVSGGKVTEWEFGETAVIDATLTQEGEAADAKATGDAIFTKVNKPTSSPNGTAGQLLRTNGDGTTQWVDSGLPTDEQTAEAVTAWLNAHPEATTTVVDGSITYNKLHSDVSGDITGIKNALNGKAPAIIITETNYENTLSDSVLSVSLDGPVTHTVCLFDTEDIIYPIAKKISVQNPTYFETCEYVSPNTINLDGTMPNDTWLGLSTSGSNYRITLSEALPIGTKLSFRAFITGSITGTWPYINIGVNGSNIRTGLTFDQTTHTASFDYTAVASITYFELMTKCFKNSVLSDVNISYVCYADSEEITVPAFNTDSYLVNLSNIEDWTTLSSTPVKNKVRSVADTKTYVDEHTPEDYVKQSEIVDFIKRQELNYIMPEFFGAVGNGITDDTTAIQNCINYAISNGNIPVKMFSKYKTTGTITIYTDNLNLYCRDLNNETSNPAIIIKGNYNIIQIDKIRSTGDSITLQATDDIETNKNVIKIDFCYSRQSKCIVLTATETERMYGNEFHLKELNAATNCIYCDQYSGGEHSFFGYGCGLSSGSWAIYAGAPSNKYIGFLMEAYTKKGVYVPRYARCGGKFQYIRTTEMMDRINKDNSDADRGLFAKGPGVCNLELIGTPVDYVAIDVSECPTFVSLQQSANTADVRITPMYKNTLYRYCDSGGKLEDGSTAGVQCFMPKKAYMIIWFGNKYITVDEDFIYDVSQDIVLPNGGIKIDQQIIIPTVFNITDDCEITLSASYNPIAIKRITIVQNVTGKSAIVYDHNGNTIFDGSSHANGVYTLNCVIVPDTYTEGPSPYTFEHLYNGNNEQWILQS